MCSLRVGSRLVVATIGLALLFFRAGSSWAGASAKEICDVDADTALGLEDYSVAIALHRKLLHADSHNALAHYHLGFAYGISGNTREEISEYLQASRMGLNTWDLYLNLGLAYMEQHDQQSAIRALQTAVLLGPEHPEPYFNMAIAYNNSNRFSEALVKIDASLSLAPQDPDARNMKAIICAELGDFGCARGEWQHLLQVMPEYAPARTNLTLLNRLHLSLPAPPSTRLN
jgi:Flp pilus assembly protein TadD